MISNKERLNILADLNTKPLEEVHKQYDVPIALLKEWKEFPPSYDDDPISNTLLQYLLDDPKFDTDATALQKLSYLEEKIITASSAILAAMLSSNPVDGYTSRALGDHAKTIATIKNAIFSRNTEDEKEDALQNLLDSLTA